MIKRLCCNAYNQHYPVRPTDISLMCGLREDDDNDESWELIGDASIPVDPNEVSHGVMPDLIDSDDDGEVIQPPAALPEPRMPSKSEMMAHRITHLPYRSWCQHCVQTRRQNSQHRRKSPSSQRTHPLLVADYCYLQDTPGGETLTVLVARLFPAKAIMAVVCPSKTDDFVINRLAHFIRDSGYARIVYKSDQ